MIVWASSPNGSCVRSCLPDDVLREGVSLGGRGDLLGEWLGRVDQVLIEAGIVREVAPAQLGIGALLERAPPLRRLGLGAPEHVGEPGKDPDAARGTAVASARSVDLLTERDPGLDVALWCEHEIGDLTGELDPGR